MLLAVDTLPQIDAPVRWRLATRIAFRWTVVYFTLYVCFTQMLSGLIVLPVGDVLHDRLVLPVELRYILA